jgi:hypothetical protein
VPLGICLDETIVGFAMFEPRGNDVYSLPSSPPSIDR